MRNIDIINANTDLGVHVDGARLGPDKLTEDLIIKNNIRGIYKIYANEENKENKPEDKDNKKKNLEQINVFNKQVYDTVKNTIERDNFPVTLGGDHSLVIGSALASIAKNKSLGIIWIDAHGDYNTFDTTITGNIHGLPLAAIDGYEKKYLTDFHDGSFYKPENTVIVGGRDIDPLEIENIKDAGVTVFTTEEIHKRGMSAVMEDAIAIATKGTDGMHISYDLDVIDPKICPGVSVPAVDGINLDEAYDAVDSIIKHKASLKSLDIVEYNPKRDIDNKTKNIAKTILESIINNI
ncbi:MAG: arginase [Clostridia bacterium]|nr:arginase [Clostridia bacterium]